MKIADLERHLRKLLREQLPPEALRTSLDALAAVEPAFGGLTWLWAPELDRRDRVFFRPLIMGRFASFYLDEKRRWQRVEWKGAVAEALEPWLREVDARDDVALFRRLITWKYAGGTWRGVDEDRLRRETIDRFRKAATPARRRIELEKMDTWFRLDEATALVMYRTDREASRAFILKRLPVSFWSDATKRQMWEQLRAEASKAGDEKFARDIYRRQVPPAQWVADVKRLAAANADGGRLCEELEQIHPRGIGNHLAEGFAWLIEHRGRDVQPYLMAHLGEIWSFWGGIGNLTKMIEVAAVREWWDLWAALIRRTRQARFDDEVAKLLDGRLPDGEAKRRLLLLAGVSREFNLPGLGLAQVHRISDNTALRMLERFPELLRGPFRLHLQLNAWDAKPALAEKLIQAGEDDLVDFLASRVLSWVPFRGNYQRAMDVVSVLTEVYRRIRDEQPERFAKRAANVLNQVPAYGIWSLNRLMQKNSLARLLLERSVRHFLDDPVALSDLVEAPNIHVQMLAYRALGEDDPRAVALAARHRLLLLGTLLRPIHRATRMAAIRALANAALHEFDFAKLTLQRAREALALPDIKYPKEALVGLMGRILHRWPELRGPGEQPVIYGLAPEEAAA